MKNTIGLDIGLREVRLVNLALKGKDVELLKFDIVELPKISSPYEIIELLKSIFKNNQLELNTPVCLSISAEESFFKIISVKSQEKKDIKELIKDELKKDVIFPLVDYVWDYSILKCNPKELTNEVLLVAAKKEAVFEKIQLIEKNNGFMHLINLEILATYNCLKFNTDFSSGKIYALVDVSYDKTQVLIFDDTWNFWIWTMPFGGNKFIEATAKNLGLSIEEAKEHKKKLMLQENVITKPDDASLPVAGEFVGEIDKTFNYYYFQTSESATKEIKHKIDEILLSGEGSIYCEIDKFLVDKLNIPTRYIYPLNKILIKDKRILSKKNILNTQSPQLVTAIGLALQGLNLTDIKTNLIKETKESSFKNIIMKLLSQRSQ